MHLKPFKQTKTFTKTNLNNKVFRAVKELPSKVYTLAVFKSYPMIGMKSQATQKINNQVLNQK